MTGICFLTLGCQDAYYRKCAAVSLLTQHNYHYKLTLQLYTTGSKMSLSTSTTTLGGWEGACTKAAKDKNCICSVRMSQARHAPQPRLPNVRNHSPASFMLQPAGNLMNEFFAVWSRLACSTLLSKTKLNMYISM